MEKPFGSESINVAKKVVRNSNNGRNSTSVRINDGNDGRLALKTTHVGHTQRFTLMLINFVKENAVASDPIMFYAM